MRSFARVAGVAILLAIGCEPYGSCSEELEIGDGVAVEITKIYWGKGCSTFSIDEGSVVDLRIADWLKGERCESATGPTSIDGVHVSGPMEMADETEAHSAFYGRYALQKDECSAALELSVSFEKFQDGKSKAGVRVDVISSTCEAQCSFNAHGVAVRQ